MFQIPDMSSRLFVPERMDDTAGPEEDLFRTLRDFRIVNLLFSRTGTLVKRYLIPHMLRQGARNLVVADVGSGGCDFALWFTRLCRRGGITIRVLCIDNDPRAIAFCRRGSRGHEDITIHEASAFSIDEINGPIDYIFSNHFLHHIESALIPGLMRKFHDTARCGFLINDLARSVPAYVGFSLFSLAFLHSGLSRHDGKLSIRKGFIEQELADLATQAALSTPFSVGTLHPARVFLCCLKDTAAPQRVPSVNAMPGTAA
jgi:SAM-dependent methyltransferase